MKFTTLFAVYALATAALLGTATDSKANVTWLVNGVFDDTGTLSGEFTIDQYGFLLNNFNLQTTSGTLLPGFDYNSSDSYYSNGTFYVDAQPGYQADLHLQFTDSLDVASLNNPIMGGAPGPSWECQGSFSCFVPSGGETRYLASGVASAVPEPATWAMMLVGFAGLGFAGYRKSRSVLRTA
jgi:hypothetical protein